MKAILLTLCTIILLGLGKPSLKFDNHRNLTVCIYNETDNPISVSSTSGFANLNDFQKISYQKVDTLHLKINKFDYVYFSHKNTFGYTLLAAAGDTLKLIAKSDQIESKLISTDQNIRQFEKAISGYAQRDSVLSLTKRIDSLTRLFYTVDLLDKPLLGGNDYQKFSSSPLKVNRTAIKTNPAALQLLVSSIMSQYQAKINFFSTLSQAPSKELYVLEQNKEIKDLYISLLLIYNLSQDQNLKARLNSTFFINNSLIQNPFGKTILGSYLRLALIQKKPDYSKSKMSLDYKEAYVNAPKYLSKELAKYARLISIENMVEGESFLELAQTYNAFKAEYKDAQLNSMLEKKYLFDINQYKVIKDDLKLIDVDRRIVSFSELLKKEKGKLIYIDFWASWCAPCRAAMPSSRQLLNEFKDKKIVFVYLSTDKDTNQWKQAAAVEKIYDYSYSYQILNMGQSSFINQIALKEIPRYLLFDQTGKLLHQTAPGPEGNEIRELINKNLK